MSEETKRRQKLPSRKQRRPKPHLRKRRDRRSPEKEAEAEPADAKKKDGWFNKKAREMDAVKAKLDAAEKNAAQAKDQLLRMAAEYENYRKRSTREADQKFNDGVSFAVNQIIPILDTLEMAANAPPPMRTTKGRDYDAGQSRQGTGCPPCGGDRGAGQAFDPNFMNAVQQIPAPDGQRAAPSSRCTRKATSWATRSSATRPSWWPSKSAKTRRGFEYRHPLHI